MKINLEKDSHNSSENIRLIDQYEIKFNFLLFNVYVSCLNREREKILPSISFLKGQNDLKFIKEYTIFFFCKRY